MNLTEDEQDLIALSQKHGLELRSDDIEINDIGLDFRVVFAMDAEGAAWVLRIPRRADVIPKARQEYKTLELVKSHLPIEVPNWKIFTDELIAYPRLSGKPAVAVDIVGGEHIWQIDTESPIYTKSFAESLAALHTISAMSAADAGLKISTAADTRRTFAENVELVESEIGIGGELLSRWQAWLDNDALWDFSPALIHGDIHQAHLLVDEESRVIGILDWTEAEVGDPSIDFATHLWAFGDEALRRLIADYEKAGGATRREMPAQIAEQIAAFPVKYALFALTTKNSEMIETAKKQLGI